MRISRMAQPPAVAPPAMAPTFTCDDGDGLGVERFAGVLRVDGWLG